VNYEFLLSLLYFVDQVHIEADRKAMANQVNVPADLPFQSRTTYRIRNKVAFAPPIIAFSNIVLYLVSMYAEIGAALVGFFFLLVYLPV
jgi:centromere protein O